MPQLLFGDSKKLFDIIQTVCPNHIIDIERLCGFGRRNWNCPRSPRTLFSPTSEAIWDGKRVEESAAKVWSHLLPVIACVLTHQHSPYPRGDQRPHPTQLLFTSTTISLQKGRLETSNL